MSETFNHTNPLHMVTLYSAQRYEVRTQTIVAGCDDGVEGYELRNAGNIQKHKERQRLFSTNTWKQPALLMFCNRQRWW